jgi:hypothetical protein
MDDENRDPIDEEAAKYTGEVSLLPDAVARLGFSCGGLTKLIAGVDLKFSYSRWYSLDSFIEGYRNCLENYITEEMTPDRDEEGNTLGIKYYQIKKYGTFSVENYKLAMIEAINKIAEGILKDREEKNAREVE